MTQEDKNLLLKDLCARLLYNVVICCTDSDTKYNCFLTTDILSELLHNIEYYSYKPYLRPMSSMTEEESKKIDKFKCTVQVGSKDYDLFNHVGYVDFLNKHMFDYRNLIKRGLAIEAPKDMYKFNH